jgi:hypothetical protein
MAEQEVEVRKESHKLINELKKMQGDLVTIRTFGEWAFAGRLVGVDCELAILSEVTVLGSGGLTLCAFDVSSVTVNLEALTSVGKPVDFACCVG